MLITCKNLTTEYRLEWDRAIRHPFLAECKSASITPAQFNTWLVQDYLFVTEFARMAGRLLSVAPVKHMDTLLGGIGALKDELIWFVEKAQERALDLCTATQKAGADYRKFMASLGSEPYAAQAVAFWAIEAAYNQAWRKPGPMSPPYDEFAVRWGSENFGEYVAALENQANEALFEGGSDSQARAKHVFRTVAELENRFWDMAYQVTA
ncbi:MAG: TenA family transcriptional regulator [Chitinivibrionales bacterium]|nr:TenA family transcriptional regulator [Chitinivibrionales bacterium]